MKWNLSYTSLPGKADRCRAFTLIELLIVVAIITILAAIAVPNFLEAQTRAKIGRCKADFRTIATGLELYHVDNNVYPKSNNSSRVLNPWSERAMYRPTLERLTTPISYLTGKSAFYDPFKARFTYQGPALASPPVPMEETPGDIENFQLYWYVARNRLGSAIWDQAGDETPRWWILEGAGPDACHHNPGDFFNTLITDDSNNRGRVGRMLYDPTNGTISRGSIWRTGGIHLGDAKSFYVMVEQQNGG